VPQLNKGKNIMGRSIGKVIVAFGMTSIAVKMYLSATSNRVTFNQINPKTGNRIKQKLVDAVDGTEVPRNELLSGFEYAKDKFVTFTDEEIANMQAKKKDTLDIAEFVSLSQIDPLMIEKVYYLGPDKGFDRDYMMLYHALKESQKTAIGTWVARGKEHLVAIRAYKHGLIMQQMYYTSEVRTFDDMCANIQISPKVMVMAKLMIDHLSSETFNPSKYRDSFIDKVKNAVELKLKGGEITTPNNEVPQVNDMESSLRAQLLAIGMKEEDIDKNLAIAVESTDKLAPKRTRRKKVVNE
jgi:DNA end-binding protein Ku